MGLIGIWYDSVTHSPVTFGTLMKHACARTTEGRDVIAAMVTSAMMKRDRRVILVSRDNAKAPVAAFIATSFFRNLRKEIENFGSQISAGHPSVVKRYRKWLSFKKWRVDAEEAATWAHRFLIRYAAMEEKISWPTVSSRLDTARRACSSVRDWAPVPEPGGRTARRRDPS